MDACKKSILSYQVSDTRAVGPCILTMRMAFEKFKVFPNKALKFIADGYSAYPLAGQQTILRMQQAQYYFKFLELYFFITHFTLSKIKTSYLYIK